MKFSLFAPGTIGNVASGFDVLGLAVDELGDLYHIEEDKSYRIKVSGRDDELIPIDPEQNATTIAAAAFYKIAGVKPQPFSVHIERALPVAGGLGSSAAASVAGALAAARLSNAVDRVDWILKAALAGEGAVAGPHLDNIAPCFFGGLTLVQDVETLSVYPLPISKDFAIVLVTPNLKIRTKDARQILPEQLKTSEWTKQMAHCTTLALALSRGDWDQLRFGLTDPFAEPARSKLIPGFNEAKTRAIRAGAFGFSISGSGPTCFALCPDRERAVVVGRELETVFGPDCRLHLVKPRLRGAEIL